MLAAIVEKPGNLVIKDIPKPKIKDNQVLIKVESASICNATDNHILHGVFDGYHDFYPQLLGHEVAGEVVQVGNSAIDFKSGERIVCYSPYGAFAEYIPVDAVVNYCAAKIPDSIFPEWSSLIEMSHGTHLGAVYPAQIKKDEHVLVVGQGPMGLTTAAYARLYAKTISVVDFFPFRLEKAKEMGADFVYNRSEMSGDEIAKAVVENGNEVDVVIMAIAEDKSKELNAFNTAVKTLRENGRMTGLVVDVKNIDNNHRIDPHALIKKNIHFQHEPYDVYGEKREENMLKVFQDAVNLAANGSVPLQKLKTHEICLDELEHGLELCDKKLNEVIKIVVYPKQR